MYRYRLTCRQSGSDVLCVIEQREFGHIWTSTFILPCLQAAKHMWLPCAPISPWLQKYDIPKPTYDKWLSIGWTRWYPSHGISFILAKRCDFLQGGLHLHVSLSLSAASIKRVSATFSDADVFPACMLEHRRLIWLDVCPRRCMSFGLTWTGTDFASSIPLKTWDFCRLGIDWVAQPRARLVMYGVLLNRLVHKVTSSTMQVFPNALHHFLIRVHESYGAPRGGFGPGL
jgi:hypothetical protein